LNELLFSRGVPDEKIDLVTLFRPKVAGRTPPTPKLQVDCRLETVADVATGLGRTHGGEARIYRIALSRIRLPYPFGARRDRHGKQKKRVLQVRKVLMQRVLSHTDALRLEVVIETMDAEPPGWMRK
jgi:hypothetical protein